MNLRKIPWSETEYTKDGLLKAIKENHLKNVERILCRNKVLIEERYSERATPLLIASKYGHYDIVSSLIRDGACKLAVDSYGRSALHLAVLGCHKYVIEYLVDVARFDPSGITVTGETPLHLAAEKGFLEAVSYFVGKAKGDIHRKNSDGKEAVHIAALRGHVHVVKFLWEKSAGVPFGVCNEGRTALHYACMGNNLDVVMYLVNVVGEEVSSTDRNGKIPADFTADQTIKRFLDAKKPLIISLPIPSF